MAHSANFLLTKKIQENSKKMEISEEHALFFAGFEPITLKKICKKNKCFN